MDTVVEVAVESAAFDFDRLYSYCVPPVLAPYAVEGARVLVPFGQAAPRMGVILKKGDDAPASGLKSIIDVERGEPALSDGLLPLVFMLRETTFCTYYAAVRAVLPKNSRLVSGGGKIERAASGHLETVYELTTGGIPDTLTEKQRAAAALLQAEGPQPASEIMRKLNITRGVIQKLAAAGVVRQTQRPKTIEIYQRYLPEEATVTPELTDAQRAALISIEKAMADEGSPRVTLLRGITGSGKTLIYIKLIERTISRGGRVLVLVPEIALATQMIYRLRGLFGERVGIIHSALSDTERQLQWDRIKQGDCDVVVGTRSAVFAPVKQLELVIMDEEQEQGYVSDKTPRYSARAVAEFRINWLARQGQRPHLLLASATPSVESYYKAKSGAYQLVILEERYGAMPLPAVGVVDMRQELLAGNSQPVSARLKADIDARLARGEQCILLLNRRGYRPLSLCGRCRKIVKCPGCDTPLVLHRTQNRYICHYCGKNLPVEELCGDCGGAVRHTGIGTQKMEEDLEALFPDARIVRLDLDSASKKYAVERILFDFSRGKYDIMVGTQMIAKGLDFPKVTLAGVLSIDQFMLMPGYRAGERAFAMLTQVVGRSGRGGREGEAIIQTLDPENEIIRLAAGQDYESFYRTEILLRKTHLYPPFCALCAVGFTAPEEAQASLAAETFARQLQEVQEAQFSELPIRVLGPAPARVAYINHQYRYRVIIKHRAGGEFRAFLRECLTRYSKGAQAGKARFFVDFVSDMDN